MADETLLSAARRVVRFFNIDMNAGGLVTVDTQAEVETLDAQVRREAARQNTVYVETTPDPDHPTMRN
jgi:hypothetical protein